MLQKVLSLSSLGDLGMLPGLRDLVNNAYQAGCQNIHEFEAVFFGACQRMGGDAALYPHLPDTIRNPDTARSAALRVQLRECLASYQADHVALAKQALDILEGTQPDVDNAPLTALCGRVTSRYKVIIQGAGPAGLWMALQLARLEIFEIDIVEKRDAQHWADRYGSVSIKSWYYFLDLLDPETRQHFLEKTEAVRFAADDPYSPNALRASVGTYQRTLKMALDKCRNVTFHFGEDSATPYVDDRTVLHVHAEGVSGRARALAQAGASEVFGYVAYPGLTTYAETAVDITHCATQTGFVRKNAYAPGSSQTFNHLRAHVVADPHQLDGVIGALRHYHVGEEKQTRLENTAHDMDPTTYLAMEYRMCSHADPGEADAFGDAFYHSRFSITPDKLERPFLPAENGQVAQAFVGDASGQVHFIGGYGMSKAAKEIHLLSSYLALRALIEEMANTGRSAEAESPTKLARQALNAFFQAKHSEAVAQYFALCVIDALVHFLPGPIQVSPPTSPEARKNMLSR